MATPSKNYRELDHGCFTRAHNRGEQTFTLTARDPTGPATICEWIKLNIDTAPDEKLRDALEEALIMRKHPNRRHAD